MGNSRQMEIINSFKKKKKKEFFKNEELSELEALRDEVLENPHLLDAEEYLKKQNEERNGIATAEYEKFENCCKDLTNMIKGVKSGIRGEKKAFHLLKQIRLEKRILQNIVVHTPHGQTEIDDIVISNKGVFIVEVKNSSYDALIDNRGVYYRTGKHTCKDSDLGQKMRNRIEYIRSLLDSEGYSEIPVKGIVVFTNDNIKLTNDYYELDVCFPSQLTHIIEEEKTCGALADKDLDIIAEMIRDKHCIEAHPMKNFDSEQFKKSFADLIIALDSPQKKEKPVLKGATGVNTKVLVRTWGLGLASIIMCSIPHIVLRRCLS